MRNEKKVKTSHNDILGISNVFYLKHDVSKMSENNIVNMFYVASCIKVTTVHIKWENTPYMNPRHINTENCRCRGKIKTRLGLGNVVLNN